MTTKIEPPKFSTSGKPYERYKQELLAWREVTSLPKNKQAIAIALSLPEQDSSKIREKVFDELSIADLKAESGFDTLVTYLDKQLKVDDLADSCEKYEHFEECIRGENQTVSEFINEFDLRYNKITKKNIILPQEVLAFKLIKSSKISKEERLLVMTGLDYSKKDDLYEQAKQSLKKFKGTGSAGCDSAAVGQAQAIKIEPTLLVENEEVLWNMGYAKRGGYFRGGSQYRGPNYPGSYRGFYRGNTDRGYHGYRGNTNENSRNQAWRPSRGGIKRNVNPTGPDGNTLLCNACGSFRHLIADCPDSWENNKPTSRVSVVEDHPYEHAVLFTGNKDDVTMLGIEASNSAVLDSACSRTVCGQNWLNDYLSTLSDTDLAKVKRSEGGKIFKFGGGEKLQSVEALELPAILVGKDVTIKTDVVTSDIPLLLSREAMKKARVKLDMENDSAEILGEQIALNVTSSGHYCTPITRDISVESIYSVKLDELSEKEKYKAILKLHRQFAHPKEMRLKALLVDAKVWEPDLEGILADIQKNCDICKVYARNPDRPVVSLPMAQAFNDRVAMDLKSWNGKWILHMIDMWSRLTVSVFLDRKRTSDVVEKVITHWIGTYGVMKSIMSDNGGEFSSDELREVASILNIEVCTSAGESPFQNGLCERVHAVTDNMLLKLKAEYKNSSEEILLKWVNMVRNSLQMWNGFSSHQLVFGRNPNLPNIMSDRLPALEGHTSSEILAEHLNLLHASRRAFIQSEASERIRRALRSKVRAIEQTFQNGDRVFYKRDGKERWLGPGKVVFQDGKVIFVRHGGSFVRVSPNRLVKANHAFENLPDEGESRLYSNDPGMDNIPKEPVVSELWNDNDIEFEEVPVDHLQDTVDIEDHGVVVHSAALPVSKEKIKYRQSDAEEWKHATVLGRAGKASGTNRYWINVENDTTGVKSSINLQRQEWEKIEETVNMVIVPRKEQNSEKCIIAKQQELQKLKDFGTYEEVPDKGQQCISTRWILNEKGSGIRARLVARGFEEEESIQSDSPTVGKSAVRVFLSISTSKHWIVKTTDIKSAFLQGRNIDRDVFIAPPKEAKVDKVVWKLKKCLYGLNDAARQFYYSVVAELKRLGCTQSALDPSLFYFKSESGQLLGMLVSHIDDFLHAGDTEFDKRVMSELTKRFVAGKVEESSFTYIGFKINQTADKIIMDQNSYTDSIDCIKLSPQRCSQKEDNLNNTELSTLRSLAGSINWLVQGSRPDLSFELIETSTKFKNGKVLDLLNIMKTVKKAKTELSQVCFPDLGQPKYWEIILFSDAAHANLNDGVSSTLGYVVFLANQRKVCPLSWRTNKIKRVVRSTLAAETLSLQEGLEDAFYVKSVLADILGQKTIHDVPVIAYVDNKSLVEAVHSTRMVDDKRLRIDIGAIKQSLEVGDVKAVKWCQGSSQLANCLTKKGASGIQLLAVFQTGTWNL